MSESDDGSLGSLFSLPGSPLEAVAAGAVGAGAPPRAAPEGAAAAAALGVVAVAQERQVSRFQILARARAVKRALARRLELEQARLEGLDGEGAEEDRLN